MAREDATLLDEFFDHCPEMLFTLDKGSTIIRLSEPLRRLLGLDARPGTTMLSAYVHPDDRRAFDAASAALAEGEPEVGFDARVRAADGAYQAVSLRARREPSRGEIHGSLRAPRAARDPSPAKLEEYGKILKVLLDGLSIIVCAVDPTGTFIFQEGKALATAGLTPRQFLGMNILDLYGEHKEAPRIRQALAGEPVHTISEVHDAAWESWYIPVRDEQGALTSVVTFTIDLTDARKAEAELRAQIELIERQQRVIRSLSTPIIEVWDKVLTLPVLGVIDSGRAAEVMENLLQQVSGKGSRFAILDLTGVDALDTGTAGHLIKLIQALRLLGAEGIITGIQPAVAQTIVALGVNLEDVVTLASLRDGLRLCMKRLREEKREGPKD